MMGFFEQIWNSGVKGRAGLVVAAVIILGALIGVLVGVLTKGFRKDRGFMRRNGKAVKWHLEDFPLTVWLHPTLQMDYRRSLRDVSLELTKVIGRAPFMFVEAGDLVDLRVRELLRGHVSVRDDEGEHPDHGSTFYAVANDGYMRSCEVVLPEYDDPQSDKPYRIALHEMCHVLGLEHDDGRESIMHPVLQSRPQGLSDKDKKLLRKTYG